MKYFFTTLFLFFNSIGVDVISQTLNPNRLELLLQKAEEAHSEAIIIYQDNQLITEQYFGIGTPDKLIETMSCTKSIVGLAVACLLSDGLIEHIDIPVHQFYPEWRQGQKQYITVRHLIEMTSGLQNVPNTSLEIYPSPDFVQLALAAEMTHPAGTRWSYNNKALNLMSGIFQKVTGKRMDDYIGDRLFKPLDIVNYSWTLDPAGNPHVMSGCQIRPSDFVKLGLLLLHRGYYNGQEVIASDILEQLLQPGESFKGYGMLWWIDHEQTISVVDDSTLQPIHAAGFDEVFLEKIEQIRGVYDSDEAYIAQVEHVFGENPWNYLSQVLGTSFPLRRRIFQGSVSYRADGYLGNYLIVDPRTKIVAIRMITHDSYTGPSDNFGDFRKMILSLCAL